MPEDQPSSSQKSKKGNRTGNAPASSGSPNSDPLAEIENTIKREVKIGFLQDMKDNQDMTRLRKQQLQTQVAQAATAPPGFVPAQGYGPNPYGMPGQAPAPPQPAPQVPVPVITPVDKDGKPDTNALAMMGAMANPQNPLAYMLMLPQLMAGLNGNKGTSSDAMAGILAAMQAVNSIKGPPPAPTENSTDTLLKAITTVASLKPDKGPEPNKIEELTAQLQFMKGMMEMTGASQRPASGGDSNAQMFAAVTQLIAQQTAQTQAMMQTAAQQQMQMMQQQVEFYKAQAAQQTQQAQAAAQQDPLGPLRMMKETLQTVNDLGALQSPQAQDPKMLLEMKRMEMEMAEQAHKRALDDRKSEGWMSLINSGVSKLSEAFSGNLGQSIGEGVKDTLKMAAQAQFEGRSPMMPGPIVQVPTMAPQYPPQSLAPQYPPQATVVMSPPQPAYPAQTIPQQPLISPPPGMVAQQVPPQFNTPPQPVMTSPQPEATGDPTKERMEHMQKLVMRPGGGSRLGGGINPAVLK